MGGLSSIEMNTSNYKKLTFAGFLVASLFVATFFVYPTRAAEPSREQIASALNDLSQATGQAVTSEAQAKAVCDSEKFLTVCAEIGKRHNLYQPEEVKQVDSFLQEIKGKIAQDLQSCQNVECLIGVANNLAKKISATDSKLAVSFDLTTKLVERKQAVITAAKELGVNYEQCSSLNPDTASIELLRSCARLAKDSRVQEFLPASVKAGAINGDKLVDLKESLAKGEFKCGDGTSESCGNFCLNPTEATKSQGIPEVCRQIAKKFFGQDGEKQLQSAYDHVQQTQDFYSKKAENTVFTTIDGKKLTSLDDIGSYMEQQGKQGNVEAVAKGMDFMIAKGFIKPEEKEYALKFVKQARDSGGQMNFDQCAQNPQSCRDFVPQDQRGEFDASIKLHDTVQQELGFDPRECAKAVSDQALGQKCLEASKKALPQIQALGLRTSSPDTQKFIREFQQNISRTDDFYNHQDNLNQTYQSQQGGPGGCKSEQDCRSYCSDPSHGPECIAFGAKQGISGFKGQEAVQRFQQFNDALKTPESQQKQAFDNSQGGFDSQGQRGQQGQQDQSGFQPPGQGGFNQGPSPECFASIQSGDFVKAKELCTVNIPHPQPIIQPSFIGPPVTVPPTFYPSPSGSPIPYPSDSYIPTPYPSGSPTGNPELDCKNHGGIWDATTKYCKFPVPSYSPSPSGTYTPYPSPSPSYTPYPSFSPPPTYGPAPSYSSPPSPYPSPTMDPAIGCAKYGGTWNGTICVMPSSSTTPMPSVSYTPYPSPSGTYTPYPSPSGSYTPYPSPYYSPAPSYSPPPTYISPTPSPITIRPTLESYFGNIFKLFVR